MADDFAPTTRFRDLQGYVSIDGYDGAPLAELAGHLIQEQEGCPEQYLVEGFPTANELSQIGRLDFH